MKKLTAILVASATLAACSNKAPENQYKGDIILSSQQDNVMMITLLRNDCQPQEGVNVESQVLTIPYNSHLVVGACALVTTDENGKVESVKNVSRSKSNSLIHRTGKY